MPFADYTPRRLLYVACTRAQVLLYVLHADKRIVAGKTKVKRLSEFIDSVRKKDEVQISHHVTNLTLKSIILQGLFSYDVPRFLDEDRAVLSNVLNRSPPDKEEVYRRLAQL